MAYGRVRFDWKKVSVKQGYLAGGFFLFIYIVSCLKVAWICDDAFITFRSVDNFIQGYGPVWNVAERVQTFTHPLWFLLLSLFNFITGELYYTSIFLSWGVSLAVFYVLWRWRGENQSAAVLALGVLAFSKSYVEYSSSGLENSLSHFLIVVFFFYYLYGSKNFYSIFWLSLLSGLEMLTRMDLFLLFCFPLSVFLYKNRSWKNTFLSLAGFIPVILWELFSLFYYGFPFPNTAYAKMICTGVDHWALIKQGIHYFQNSFYQDPLTLSAIIAGLLTPLLLCQRHLYPFILGILSYLIYIVYVGGDFMSGRFLTVPLCASVLLITQIPLESFRFNGMGIILLIILLGVFPSRAPLRTGSHYGDQEKIFCDANAIYDERLQYYPKTGLFAPHRWDLHIFRNPRVPQPLFAVEERIGMKGYLAGPKTHILDYLALADPLLARLPAIRLNGAQNFRIAHFYRFIPDGYIDSLMTGENHLKENNLSIYYDKLRIIIRGRLWSMERWKEIVKMNLGYYDSLIHQDYYQSPPIIKRKWNEVFESENLDRVWFDRENTLFSNNGLSVNFEKIIHSPGLSIRLDQYGNYEIDLLRGKEKIYSSMVGENWKEALVLKKYELFLPETVWKEGYSELIIKPIRFSNRHSFGGVVFK